MKATSTTSQLQGETASIWKIDANGTTWIRIVSRAMKASTVLPAPVGSTTTPRPAFASQLRSASR